LRRKRLLALAGASALLACSGAAASAAPLHELVPSKFTQPPTTAQCEAAIGIACYSPNQLEQAYNMNPLYKLGLNGRGKTIVIVDSFGSPTITQDLATFDQAFGLPAPPSFKIIQPAGPVPPFDPTNATMANWGIETSLDVEYAHAMAPGANILLVETPVAETEGVTGLPEMMAAENYVINHHMGDVITQSFGATEETFPSARAILGLRSAFENAAAHRVTVLAASGDAGPTDETSAPDAMDFYPFRVNSWPSADPLVTSVGGLQLHLDADGNRTAPDQAWNDTATLEGNQQPAAGGGGVSAVFSRPFYQGSVARIVGDRRGTPDVSLNAAIDGGAIVFWSYDASSLGFPPPPPGGGIYGIIGGTSEASPLFSGIVAVADQAAHRDLGLINPTLYRHEAGPFSGLDDVSAGDTTVTFVNPDGDPFPGQHTVPGFASVQGYDLATGLGTPDGPKLVAELALSRGGFSKRR
jgi:subtilase family serine protease